MIMQDDEQLLEHRFADLARRASERRIAVYSEFLDLAQQETLERMKGLSLDSGWGMWGGFEGAERRIARFGGGERDGYPLVYLTVSPRAAKFADELTHRDFLGALMSLGMRREVLGDILVDESCATVVCLASAAEYMAENLERIKRTSVVCALSSQSPKTLSPAMREDEVVISSERLDAVVAAVCTLSREQSRRKIEQALVFINSRRCESGSRELADGDIVSVRGWGRFVYRGVTRETKKGRLRAAVGVFV